jgi:heme-degrading monooxygenase HmoA
MIARLWHGVVPAAKADAYYAYLLRTGIPDYRQTLGNRGVQILRREQDDRTHFLLLTFWESLDALRRFAGDQVETARYYPEDAVFLIELEPQVVHYEVLAAPPGKRGVFTYTTKTDFLAIIRAWRAALEALWSGVSEAHLAARPSFSADWSVKDLIAHITYWEQDLLRQAALVKQGGAPVSEDTDTVNARVFAANAERPLTDVLADFYRSGETVFAFIATLSEAELTAPAPFPGGADLPVWQYIAYETVEHYDEHLDALRAWREGLPL